MIMRLRECNELTRRLSEELIENILLVVGVVGDVVNRLFVGQLSGFLHSNVIQTRLMTLISQIIVFHCPLSTHIFVLFLNQLFRTALVVIWHPVAFQVGFQTNLKGFTFLILRIVQVVSSLHYMFQLLVLLLQVIRGLQHFTLKRIHDNTRLLKSGVQRSIFIINSLMSCFLNLYRPWAIVHVAIIRICGRLIKQLKVLNRNFG